MHCCLEGCVSPGELLSQPAVTSLKTRAASRRAATITGVMGAQLRMRNTIFAAKGS